MRVHIHSWKTIGSEDDVAELTEHRRTTVTLYQTCVRCAKRRSHLENREYHPDHGEDWGKRWVAGEVSLPSGTESEK